MAKNRARSMNDRALGAFTPPSNLTVSRRVEQAKGANVWVIGTLIEMLLKKENILSDDNKTLIVADPTKTELLLEIPSEPDDVSAMSQAKGLIVAGAECVPVLGKVFGEMTKQVLKAGDYSPEKRLRDLQFGWLVEAMPSLDQKIERLLNEGIKVEAPDIGAIFEAALDASRKTTGKKRQYLKNALENAFSLRMYEEGLVLRFLSMLAELEYGDVLLLESMTEAKPLIITTHVKYSDDPKVFGRREAPKSVANNINFHCHQLERCDLLTSKLVSSQPKDKGKSYILNHISNDFIWFVTADDEDLES